MQKYPQVSVVIPARNEEQNLPHVLLRIPHFVGEVILVDGHSTDATIEVARRVYPTIHILDQHGNGKEDALRQGFAPFSCWVECFTDHFQGKTHSLGMYTPCSFQNAIAYIASTSRIGA